MSKSKWSADFRTKVAQEYLDGKGSFYYLADKFTGIACISRGTDKGIYSMHLVSSNPFLYSCSSNMIFIG